MIESILLANLLGDVPWYVWFGLFIVVMIIFGDRGLWDYEVKFPYTQGVGRGEVEFECYKKKGSVIEAKFQIDTECANEAIDIYLGDRLMHSISSQKNPGGRIFIKESLEMEEPTEGDIVEVIIRGEVVFSGPLIRD